MSSLHPLDIAFLEKKGISRSFAEAEGLHSITDPDDLPEDRKWVKVGPDHPVLVIPWRSVDDRVVLQLRPMSSVVDPGSTSSKTPQKYLWAKGEPPVVHVPRTSVIPLANPTARVLLVEGTKQTQSAAEALAGTDVAVLGLTGCWGWSSGGTPAPLRGLPWKDREVLVAFDADVTTNPDVHDAATALTRALTKEFGAKSVKFVGAVGRDKNEDLDDVLGRNPVGERQGVVLRMLSDPVKLGKRPSRGSGSKYLEGRQLLVDIMAQAAVARFGAPVLDHAHRLAFYSDGRYDTELHALRGWAASELGDGYRKTWVETLIAYITDIYHPGSAVDVLPDLLPHPMANFRNGVLDLVTMKLAEHSRFLFTTMQFDVEWDPDATCPAYDAWTAEKLSPERALMRDQIFGSAFDLSRRPTRHLMLEGPSHSGKSTDIEILCAAVGRRLTTELDPHRLMDNKFAVAQVHGRRLAQCADLETLNLTSIGILKKLADGKDTVTAEHKNQTPFDFIGQALMVFATNAIPSLPGETSKAFLNRFRTIRYLHSHAGTEDETVSLRLAAELPGIVARWVRAYAATMASGQRVWAEGDVADHERLGRETDVVTMFLSERTVPDDYGSRQSAVWAAFEVWYSQEYGTPRPRNLGRNKVLERMRDGLPPIRATTGPDKGFYMLPFTLVAEHVSSPADRHGLAVVQDIKTAGQPQHGYERDESGTAGVDDTKTAGQSPNGYEWGNSDESETDPRTSHELDDGPVADPSPPPLAQTVTDPSAETGPPVGTPVEAPVTVQEPSPGAETAPIDTPSDLHSDTSDTFSLLVEGEEKKREREKKAIYAPLTATKLPLDRPAWCPVCGKELVETKELRWGKCTTRDLAHQIVPSRLSPSHPDNWPQVSP